MNPPVELVIPAAPKDYNKLPYVVQAARACLGVQAIHLITPGPISKLLEGFIPIYYHRDRDVFPFSGAVSYRPSWVFQQFIKLFQNVTMTDWYLVTDADIVFNRRLDLFSNRGKPFLNLGRDQHNEPYFDFNRKMLGYGKTYETSFLSEATLYHKGLVREMVRASGLNTVHEFWEKSESIIDATCFPAESELYGSFIWRAHPEIYELRQLNTVLGGRYGQGWTDVEIQDAMSHFATQDVDMFSLHTWEPM